LIEPEYNSLEDLILRGAVEVAGLSELGELQYKLTEEAQTIAPDLYSTTLDFFYKQLTLLWSKGFVEMDITEINPSVKLTKKAFENDEVDNLSFAQQETLKVVKQAMHQE
jgi:hypothetical protein